MGNPILLLTHVQTKEPKGITVGFFMRKGSQVQMHTMPKSINETKNPRAAPVPQPIWAPAEVSHQGRQILGKFTEIQPRKHGTPLV